MDAGGGGTTEPASCNECFGGSTSQGGSCSGSVAACFNDDACGALADCINGCSTQACVQSCGDANPGGVAKYNAIFNCVCDTGCKTECKDDGKCQQAPPGEEDGCAQCQSDQCSAEISACINDPACNALNTCLGQPSCGDACVQSCADQYSSGIGKLNAAFACVEDRCATECGVETGTGGSGGSGQAGSGQAGSGTAGTGASGSGGFQPCAGLKCGDKCDACPPNADCAPTEPTYCDASGQCLVGEPKCAACKTADDCPLYDNGTSPYCVDGVCQYAPIDPCMFKQCGDTCSTCKPGMACPEVVETCNADGKCVTDIVECPGFKCQTDKECPVSDAPCEKCPDGTTACPESKCVEGKCEMTTPVCGGLECKTAQDCPQPKGPCKICPNDAQSCPTATCTKGVCGVDYLPPCAGVVSCDADDVKATQGCKDAFAYYWNGTSCQPLNGCGCEGPDCGNLSKTYDECKEKHLDCLITPVSCGPTQVKATDGCKKVLGYYWNGATCQMLNGCECVGQCDQVSPTYDECAKLHAPCTEPGPACAPQDIKGEGMCKKQLGFAWNGQYCDSITGCSCVGNDCAAMFTSEDSCKKKYGSCGAL